MRKFLLLVGLFAIPVNLLCYPFFEVLLLATFGQRVQVTVHAAGFEPVSRGKGGTAYAPTARYSFEVEGRRWESNTYARTKPGFRKGEAQLIAEQLLKAEPQFAWVVPWRPSISAIDRGAYSEAVLFMAAAMNLIVIWVGYPLWRTRARMRRIKAP